MRLAIPRRVYTQSHIDYVVEVILAVFERREQIHGMRLTFEAPFLRHFTAHLEPVMPCAYADLSASSIVLMSTIPKQP